MNLLKRKAIGLWEKYSDDETNVNSTSKSFYFNFKFTFTFKGSNMTLKSSKIISCYDMYLVSDVM